MRGMKALFLALLLPTVSLAAVVASGSPAQAIDCRYDSHTVSGVVLERTKTCINWGNTYLGARAFDTHSFYRYYSRHQDKLLRHTLTLKDTQADGRCVSVRAERVGGPWEFNRKQAEVCGSGNSKVVQLEWGGVNVQRGGYFNLYICESGNGCKAIWSQEMK